MMKDRRKLKIGDTVKLPVKMDKGTEIMVGTIIWIHPERRFFRVEFEIHGRIIRESYNFYGKIDT